MKLTRTKKAVIGIVVVCVFTVGFFSFKQDDKNFQIAKNLDIYYTLFRELNLFYVDDVDPTKLVKRPTLRFRRTDKCFCPII